MNKATILLGMMVLVVAFFGYLNRENIIEWIGNPQIPTNLLEQLTFDNILTFIKNYGPLITLGAGAITFIYSLYERYQRSQAELRAFDIQNTASQNEEVYASVIDKLTDENKKLKQQTEGITDFSDTVSSLQQKLANKETELQRLIQDSSTTIRTLQAELDRQKLKVHETVVTQ